MNNVYKKINRSVNTFVFFYTNDIVLIGNDEGMLLALKAWLSKNFLMKD